MRRKVSGSSTSLVSPRITMRGTRMRSQNGHMSISTG